MKLLFEFLCGQLPTLEVVARIHDFLDVEFKDIAPTKLALGPFPPSEKGPKPPTAFLQGELDFLSDLIVIGDRFFGFACKRNPDRGHMNENHQGT